MQVSACPARGMGRAAALGVVVEFFPYDVKELVAASFCRYSYPADVCQVIGQCPVVIYSLSEAVYSVLVKLYLFLALFRAGKIIIQNGLKLVREVLAFLLLYQLHRVSIESNGGAGGGGGPRERGISFLVCCSAMGLHAVIFCDTIKAKSNL